MLSTVWAVVRDGRIEPLEPVTLPEGAKVLVTLPPDDDEQGFWLRVSDRTLANVWGNTEDDVYAELL